MLAPTPPLIPATSILNSHPSNHSVRGATAFQQPPAQYLINRFPDIYAFLQKIWGQPRIFQDVYATYLAFQCAEVICVESGIDLSRSVPQMVTPHISISAGDIRRFTLFYTLASQSVENRRTWLNSFRSLFDLLRQPDLFTQHPFPQDNTNIRRWLKYCTELFKYRGRQVLSQVDVTTEAYITARSIHEFSGGDVRCVRWHVMQDLQFKVANIDQVRMVLQDQVSVASFH